MKLTAERVPSNVTSFEAVAAQFKREKEEEENGKVELSLEKKSKAEFFVNEATARKGRARA